MIAAMQNCDRSYDGVFYTGVTTTGIFCLPSCRAKKPRPANVVFFPSREAALAAGFRSCKRCRPDRYPDTEPPWLRECLRLLHENTDDRYTATRLADRVGVDASTLRRGFLERFGKTPASYHRDIRLDKAARLLRARRPVLYVSEECGYRSLSGFVEAFRRRFGKTPAGYAR